MEHGDEVLCLFAESFPLPLEHSGGDLNFAVSNGNGADAIGGKVGGAQSGAETESVRGVEEGENGSAVVKLVKRTPSISR